MTLTLETGNFKIFYLLAESVIVLERHNNFLNYFPKKQVEAAPLFVNFFLLIFISTAPPP